MEVTHPIEDYTAYNLWANQELVNWLKTQPAAAIKFFTFVGLFLGLFSTWIFL